MKRASSVRKSKVKLKYIHSGRKNELRKERTEIVRVRGNTRGTAESKY